MSSDPQFALKLIQFLEDNYNYDHKIDDFQIAHDNDLYEVKYWKLSMPIPLYSDIERRVVRPRKIKAGSFEDVLKRLELLEQIVGNLKVG